MEKINNAGKTKEKFTAFSFTEKCTILGPPYITKQKYISLRIQELTAERMSCGKSGSVNRMEIAS